MFRYLFYTIGDLTYQSPLVLIYHERFSSIALLGYFVTEINVISDPHVTPYTASLDTETNKMP